MHNQERSKKTKILIQQHRLDNPEKTQNLIMHRNVSEAQKKHLAIAYRHYAKYYKLPFKMPRFHVQSKAIQIPTKAKLKALIASTQQPLMIKIQISMETGFRPVELYGLHVKDVDLEKGLLYPTTAKGGASRIYKISTELKDMLTAYINNKHLNNTKTDNRIIKRRIHIPNRSRRIPILQNTENACTKRK